MVIVLWHLLMPRKSRVDVPGALHHIIARGIEREKQMEKRYSLQARGYDLDKLASRVCDLMQVEPAELWAPGKERKRVAETPLPSVNTFVNILK